MTGFRHEKRLCGLYERWCDQQRLPAMSADELLHEEISDDQRIWLTRFYWVWQAFVEEQKIVPSRVLAGQYKCYFTRRAA